MDNKAKAIKETSEMREGRRINKDIEKILTPSGAWYYASLILVNVMSLILCYLYLDNKSYPVQKFSIVWESVDAKIVGILFVFFLGVLFLNTLPLFLKLFNKTKKRNFLISFGGTICGSFYGRVTVFGKGRHPMIINSLKKNGYKEDVAIDSVYGQKNINTFSFTFYSLLVLLVGVFFFSKNTNIILLIIGFILLIINCIKVAIVCMFNSNKKRTLEILAKLIKFAYSINLVRDYERTYNRLVDKLLIYVKDLKSNKLLLFVEVISNMIKYFLKASAIYVIVVTLNFADGGVLLELMFKCVILQLILDTYPMQNGTLIFEIVFVLLFNNVFFEGYVFWGLVIYRLFDYFAYLISFLIYKIFDKINDNKKLKENN